MQLWTIKIAVGVVAKSGRGRQGRASTSKQVDGVEKWCDSPIVAARWLAGRCMAARPCTKCAVCLLAVIDMGEV